MIEKILAAMLTLAEPGVTDASRVQLPADCAEDCVAHWDRHEAAPQNDATWMRARFDGLTRRETRLEAIERWTVIAGAIETVAIDPPELWTGTPEELWRALVTIARHESAYWGSVHDGTLRGAAGEACLLQIHPENWVKLGVSDTDLVGLDLASTERCIRAGATILAQSRDACGAAGPGWFTPTIQVYGAGQGCLKFLDSAWVQDRVATYERTGEAEPLPFDGRLAMLASTGWGAGH